MVVLNWLHLSDWHQSGSEFDRQVVQKALLKDIREREKINPGLQKIDFVIFSGDVAFGGKAGEYQAAKEQFFQPLLGACGLNPNQLFIVPGNHDLDRDEFKLLPRELTKPLASEAEVQNWLTDDRGRSRLLEPFQAFKAFVKEYTGQEQPDYVNIRRMQIGDKEIALLGLNSAWMCGRNKAKIGDKGSVIVGEPQIHSIIDDISDADLKIAVLHHPFDWLTEFDCNRIEVRLRQGCDFILRGHQHKPRVEIMSGTSGDCVIIPAGASYDRRMAGNPIYANSYNFVHLDLDTGKGRRYTVGVWVGNFNGDSMWDVSGVSGAAPIWLEVMNFLHPSSPGRAPTRPVGLESVRVRFDADLEPERAEIFLAGTANPIIRAKGGEAERPRIVYPARGVIIALDPDIPPERQRVHIQVAGLGSPLTIRLAGEELTVPPAGALWQPRPGRHAMSLVDASGAELDRTEFEVRGSFINNLNKY